MGFKQKRYNSYILLVSLSLYQSLPRESKKIHPVAANCLDWIPFISLRMRYILEFDYIDLLNFHKLLIN